MTRFSVLAFLLTGCEAVKPATNTIFQTMPDTGEDGSIDDADPGMDSSAGSTGTGTDTSTDSNTETETGTATGTETGTETQTETQTETGTGTTTETETSTGTETETSTETQTETSTGTTTETETSTGTETETETETETVDICDNVVTTTLTVSFPATSGCDWGNNGNNDATQGEISARTELSQSYVPGGTDVICDVRPSIQDAYGGFASWYFGFDDQIMLVYNGYLLFSTTDTAVTNLSSDTYGYIYDWNSIVGNSIFGSAYGIGNSYLDIPEGSGWGVSDYTEFAIDDTNMDALNQLSVDQNGFDMTMVVVGDNDGWNSNDGPDCVLHYDVSFEVEVDLAQ